MEQQIRIKTKSEYKTCNAIVVDDIEANGQPFAMLGNKIFKPIKETEKGLIWSEV